MEKFTVGVLLGGYEAQRFKNKPTPLPLKSVDVLCAGNGDAAAAVVRGQGAAKGVLLSRLEAHSLHIVFCCSAVEFGGASLCHILQ